jgi:transcriptional regulator with XRE-family HTH domain
MANKLPEWLNEKMREKGWSQARLAKESKLTRQSIANYVNGRVPTNEAIKKLAKAFKVPETELYRAAGILEAENGRHDPEIDAIMYQVKDLSQADRDMVLEFIRMLDRLRVKKK